MKKISYLGATALIAFASACSSSEENPAGGSMEAGEFQQITLSTEQKNTIQQSGEFAINYLKATNECVSNDNIILSPYSTFAALSMLANGMDGEARVEIINTLTGNNEYSIEDLNILNKTLLNQLPTIDRTVDLKIVNSIWANEIYAIRPAFTQDMKSIYDAECFEKKLGSETTRNEINNWCYNKTQGLIPEYLKKNLSDNTVTLLLNATYFNGLWKNRFDSDLTNKGIFNGVTASSSADMMSISENFTYAESGLGRIVSLPYGSENFCMYLMLPPENVNINDYISNNLDYEQLRQIMDGEMRLKEVELTLPKFKIQSDLDLNDILPGMGLKHVIGGKVPYIIDNPNVVVSDTRSAIQITVDESGTESAAISSVTMTDTSSGPIEKVSMKLDRPFVFLIREMSTGAIIMIGKVSQL